MSDTTDPAPATEAKAFDAPPLSPMPVQSPADAVRSRLHQLAAELSRSHNRRLLIEYLQIRRAVR
jgi:hypothetical protein